MPSTCVIAGNVHGRPAGAIGEALIEIAAMHPFIYAEQFDMRVKSFFKDIVGWLDKEFGTTKTLGSPRQTRLPKAYVKGTLLLYLP